MAKILVQRYDNEPDILAIKANGCTEVYQRSLDDQFDYVIVVPTLKAKSTKVVIAEAISGQYKPEEPKRWPGRPDRYKWRVDIINVRYTTIDIIKQAFEESDVRWSGQWVVKNVTLPDYLIEYNEPLKPLTSNISVIK